MIHIELDHKHEHDSNSEAQGVELSQFFVTQNGNKISRGSTQIVKLLGIRLLEMMV